MDKLNFCPRACIKTKPSAKVKQALLFGIALFSIFLCLTGCSSLPKDETEGDPNAILPKIEVRNFDAAVVRHTRSAAVYLFRMVSGEIPGPNRILLFKKDKARVMAFRVLRLYPEKNEFAGRKVRVYENHPELDAGQEFQIIEKLADVADLNPTDADRAELRELESMDGETASAPVPPTTLNGASDAAIDAELGPILEYDPELDSESSPPPRGAVDTTDEHGMSDEFTTEGPSILGDDMSGISIEEVTAIEPNPNAIMGGVGYVRAGDNTVFPAAGLRYSFRLSKMLFLNKPQLQDSFGGELGGYLGKVITEEADAFTMIPLTFVGRYTVHASEDLSFFAYAGLMKNLVLASEGANKQVHATLNIFMPAIGVGLLFRVGPSWDARIDLGYDMMGMGLSISF